MMVSLGDAAAGTLTTTIVAPVPVPVMCRADGPAFSQLNDTVATIPGNHEYRSATPADLQRLNCDCVTPAADKLLGWPKIQRFTVGGQLGHEEIECREPGSFGLKGSQMLWIGGAALVALFLFMGRGK